MVRPFCTKRHKKLSVLCILIFFVSFFFLISCGIPNPFYMPNVSSSSSSTYYTESISESSNSIELEYSIDGSDYSFSDSESVPSLVFLYAIVPSDLPDGLSLTTIKNKYISLFNSTYVNSTNGRPIQSSKDDVLEYEYNSSSDDTNYTYTLRKFHLYDSSTETIINKQTPINYGMTSVDSTLNTTNNSTISFHPEVEEGTKNFDLVLEQDNGVFKVTGSSSDITSGIYMRTYKNSNFPKTNTNSVFSEIEANDYYDIMIFTALNVTSDSYTNIFWSKLMYLGTISSSNSSNSTTD